MKRTGKAQTQEQQNSYTKMLTTLRSSLSADYSKALETKKRGVVLGYD